MSLKEEERQRLGSLSKARWRNLKQYKDWSDEQFDEFWDKEVRGIEQNVEYEKRIEARIRQFGEDYDLDDLKANDKLTLRALAQAYITLEDYELWSYNQRTEQISLENILSMSKLSDIMSGLRKDISSMQTDLNITRRVRKSDRDTSVINVIDDLKAKAKEFYEQRMSYIWCPECNMLLFTGWFHYPKNKYNKISLQCERCNHRFTVSTFELMEKRGVNSENIPEFFK